MDRARGARDRWRAIHATIRRVLVCIGVVFVLVAVLMILPAIAEPPDIKVPWVAYERAVEARISTYEAHVALIRWAAGGICVGLVGAIGFLAQALGRVSQEVLKRSDAVAETLKTVAETRVEDTRSVTAALTEATGAMHRLSREVRDIRALVADEGKREP